MNVEVREVGPRRAVCVAHSGPYFMIGSAFGRIAEWVQANGVDAREGVGIYYDDPSTVPTEQLRSHAGMFVANDFTTDDASVEVVDLEGGLFAVATHEGPYDGLMNSWTELYTHWMPTSGYEIGPAPAHEVYLNDCSQVAPEALRTEICLSLERAS